MTYLFTVVEKKKKGYKGIFIRIRISKEISTIKKVTRRFDDSMYVQKKESVRNI